jgi:Uma2 family endonuclease
MSEATKTSALPWTEWPVGPIIADHLPESDGEPLETWWHRLAMNLLIEIVHSHFRDRKDYYVGGNQFIYFSPEQLRNKDFRGPDFFFVWDAKPVKRMRDRPYWAVWKEDNKFPDVIIELLSPTTEETDRTVKKDLYEQTFKTAEYFLFDPETNQLDGWRLNAAGHYEALVPNDQGRLWSEELGLWLGPWEGPIYGKLDTMPRFFHEDGSLVPTFAESANQLADEEKRKTDKAEKQRAEAEKQRAEAEKQRAEEAKQLAEAEKQRAEEAKQREAEKQRADAAEAELVRLKALLADSQNKGNPNP